MRDALGGSLASLGRSWDTSANLGQSRPISVNLGQLRPTSADLGQSRPTSAYLGQPWPSSSTLGPRANHLGPRAQQPWPTRQSPISGRWRAHRVPSRHRLRQRPSRVGVISDRSIRPQPNPPDILGGRLSDPTPRGSKGRRLTVERAALACCPTRTPRSPFRTGSRAGRSQSHRLTRERVDGATYLHNYSEGGMSWPVPRP